VRRETCKKRIRDPTSKRLSGGKGTLAIEKNPHLPRPCNGQRRNGGERNPLHVLGEARKDKEAGELDPCVMKQKEEREGMERKTT